MNRDKLIDILLAILAINLGLIIIVERDGSADRLRKFFYVFMSLPFLAGVLILAINRFLSLPQPAEGQLPAKKSTDQGYYRQLIIDLLVWLGLSLGVALLLFLVWLNVNKAF